MAIIDILLPKMGESVAEATIINLLVEAGSSVEADEAVVEIATDKVDSEIPAPEDGVLLEWLVSKDDVVQVGDPIARFEIGGEAVVAPVTPVAETIAAVDLCQQKLLHHQQWKPLCQCTTSCLLFQFQKERVHQADFTLL